MSIRILRKKARAKAAKEAKRRALPRLRPALGALSLPEDAAGGLTRIVLLGGRRALVENLLGVAEIGRESVSLACREGLIRFSGRALHLTDIRPGGLTVAGEIHALQLPSDVGKEAGRDD